MVLAAHSSASGARAREGVGKGSHFGCGFFEGYWSYWPVTKKGLTLRCGLEAAMTPSVWLVGEGALACRLEGIGDRGLRVRRTCRALGEVRQGAPASSPRPHATLDPRTREGALCDCGPSRLLIQSAQDGRLDQLPSPHFFGGHGNGSSDQQRRLHERKRHIVDSVLVADEVEFWRREVGSRLRCSPSRRQRNAGFRTASATGSKLLRVSTSRRIRSSRSEILVSVRRLLTNPTTPATTSCHATAVDDHWPVEIVEDIHPAPLLAAKSPLAPDP